MTTRKVPLKRNKTPRIKLLTIGDSMVGKSCIVKRYCEKRFYNRYKPTIGVDYGSKQFNFNEQCAIKIDFWDMSGNDEFHDIREEFYSDTHCFVVFSVTDEMSFENIAQWISDAKQYGMKDEILYVIGNKIDCEDERKIQTFKAQKWCNANQYQYVETSAKSGIGIEELFNGVFQKVSKTIFSDDSNKNEKKGDE